MFRTNPTTVAANIRPTTSQRIFQLRCGRATSISSFEIRGCVRPSRVATRFIPRIPARRPANGWTKTRRRLYSPQLTETCEEGESSVNPLAGRNRNSSRRNPTGFAANKTFKVPARQFDLLRSQRYEVGCCVFVQENQLA